LDEYRDDAPAQSLQSRATPVAIEVSRAPQRTGRRGPYAVAVVGVDGCGKSSTFRGALERLARTISVAGIGDAVLSGSPPEPLRARPDIPSSRFTTRHLGRFVKGIRWPAIYKNL
jgi:hypothetical protein